MESIDLDMNDLFDRGDDADNDAEDYGVHAGLPDLDLDEGVMRPLEDPRGEQNEGLPCSGSVCICVWARYMFMYRFVHASVFASFKDRTTIVGQRRGQKKGRLCYLLPEILICHLPCLGWSLLFFFPC